MKLTIEVDDDLYAALTGQFYVPVLRWRQFNVVCGTGEAICNIHPKKISAMPPFTVEQDEGRKLEKRMPQQRIVPSRESTDATQSDETLQPQPKPKPKKG